VGNWAADVSAANLDTSSILELERRNETARRARLNRDLHRVAKRLDQFDTQQLMQDAIADLTSMDVRPKGEMPKLRVIA